MNVTNASIETLTQIIQKRKSKNSGLSWDDSTCQIFTFLTYGVMLLIIGIIGILGNSLTIFTLWSERKKSSTSLLLIILAFADNLLLLSCGFMMVVPPMCQNLYGTGDCGGLYLKHWRNLAPYGNQVRTCTCKYL